MVIISDNVQTARRTSVNITYQGKDISTDLAPYLLSFTFTDNSKDKADDISLSLQDRDGTWLNDWTPTKSDTISASIIKRDYPDAVSLPCGKFSVDQIEYSYPPGIMSIKAVSSDIKVQASQQKHTRFWENASLQSIAGEIAADNGLALFMRGGAETFERIDQTEQTDLEFLRALCEDYGLAVKIQKQQLVIYELEEYEDKNSVLTLSIDDPRLLNFRFSSKSAKVYKKARIKYHDVLKDEDYEAEAEDTSQEGSEKVLEIHERVESQSQAQKVAKERLAAANRSEITGSLSMIGDVRVVAGVTITLENFGAFSGKHFVNKATHKVDGSGYTTTLELGLPKGEKGKSKKAKTSKKAKKAKKGSGGSVLYYEGDRHY